MPRQIKKPIKHMEAVKEGAEFIDLASLQSAERAKIALTRRQRGCQKRICDKNIKKRYDTNNLERLKKSRRNLVKQERSICKLCAKSYKNKHILDLHVQTVHKRPKTFSCESCDKCFTQSSGLRYHIRNAHSPDINEFKPNITGAAGI